MAAIMRHYAPEGFELREPTARKIIRVPQAPIGTNFQWSADGYDKFVKYGYGVYVFVDAATGKWLGAWVVPNNRLADVVAYLFLTLVEQLGGEYSHIIPVCLRNST